VCVFVGVGIGQVVSISLVTTYYVAIMGMTVRYLVDSFKSPLPWSECQESWNAICVPSSATDTADFLYGSSISLNQSTLLSLQTSASPPPLIIPSNLSIPFEVLQKQKPTASAELYFV